VSHWRFDLLSSSHACADEIVHNDDNEDELPDTDDEEHDSDLDERQKECLVRQICPTRDKSHAEDPGVKDAGTIGDEGVNADSVKPHEELAAISCNGRTYEANKTYYRTCHDATYMYGILNLYRRPDEKEYAQCAQVLKLSDTFLSSVESQHHGYARFAGVQ